jgi:hypothetical protein
MDWRSKKMAGETEGDGQEAETPTAPPVGKKQEGEEYAQGNVLGKSAIKSSAALAALAMEGGDPWQRWGIYLCYLVTIVAIIAISMPPYETQKQLPCVFGVVLPLSIALYVVILRYRHLSGLATPSTPPGGPNNVRLATATRQQLFEVLEEARCVVRDLLLEKNRPLEDKQVRANIFLPEYDPRGAYVLKIRSGLHIHMTEPELGIVLNDGQGLTGHVFKTCEPRVAQRLPTEKTGWDLIYKITPKIAKIIHPELKWIVSMPLKGSDGKAIAVMNIDGLVHQFDIDDLYACARKLTRHAIILAGLAAGN